MTGQNGTLDAPTGELASTGGADTWMLTLLALGALFSGAALIFVASRRRPVS